VLHRIVRAEQRNEALSHDFLKGRSFSEASLQALAEADAALTQRYGADMAGWLAPVAKNKFFASNFFGVPQAGDAEARFSHVAMNRGTENNMTALGEREVRSWDVAAPARTASWRRTAAPAPTTSIRWSSTTSTSTSPCWARGRKS
jgi:penicillin amidase